MIYSNLLGDEENVNMCRNALERVYRHSPSCNKIMRRVANFRENYIKIYNKDQDLSMAIYPLDLDDSQVIDYNLQYISYNDLKTNGSKRKDGLIVINNILTGLEGMKFIAYINSKEKSNEVCQWSTERELIELIESSSLPVVFLEKKTYRYYKEGLHKANIRKPIFIYLESAIMFGFDFIKENFNGGLYTIFPYKNCFIMCIQKESFIVIQLISRNAIASIKRVLKDEEMRIEYRDFMVSGMLSLHKEIIKIVDETLSFSKYALKSKGDLL